MLGFYDEADQTFVVFFLLLLFFERLRKFKT